MNGLEDKTIQNQGEDQDNEDTIKFMDWGFNIDRLFEVAYRFYKRNESKAFHPSFDIRNQMNALILQARYGDHDSGRAPDIGVLDFVGKRRKYEWTLLKGMSKREAMSKFICTLDQLCPFFKAHAEAVKIISNFDQSDSTSDRPNDRDRLKQNVDLVKLASESKEQLKAIYSSLCRQTYNQFKGYAEKQYPSDTEQQKYLIGSLQEQYFKQYISQMHPELKDSLVISTRNPEDVRAAQCENDNINIPLSNPSHSLSDTCQQFTTSELELTARTSTDSVSMNVDADEQTNTSASPGTIENNKSVGSDSVAQLYRKSTEVSLGLDEHVPLGYESASLKVEPIIETVEADISSEELNASESGHSKETSFQDQVVNHVAAVGAFSQIVTDTKSKPIASKRDSEVSGSSPSNQRVSPNFNHIEQVKLYQNSDLPPIGPFESFPEPKPVQKKNVLSRTAIEDLNPNQRSEHSPINVNRNNFKVPLDYSPPNSVNITIPSHLEMNSSLGTVDPAESPDVLSQQTSFDNGSTTIDTLLEASFHSSEKPIMMELSSNMAQPVTANDTPKSNQHDSIRESMQESHLDIEVKLDNPQLTESELNVDQVPLANLDNERSEMRGPVHRPDPWNYASSGDDNYDEDQIDDCESNVTNVNGGCEMATTWSKKGISEFKDSLGNDKHGGIYEVKESTLVVIQVPTYPDGRYIYWEFATDDYDIAFGLDFVYETNLIQPLALTIYEESDDEEYDYDISNETSNTTYGWNVTPRANQLDPESGLPTVGPSQALMDARLAKARRAANTISIVPTYRRDSHEEVFVGRHKYPGKGYYLLKFDNTYSVLRSKSLYFRICYFI